MTSDQALVVAVLERGDGPAFRELYRRHTPRLFQLLLRMMAGDVMDAEDATQETWLRAVAALGRFRWDASLATWLAAIGLNVAREALRRRGTPAEELGDRAGPTVSPELAIDLETAIARLPRACRLVLILHDIEGWKHAEIAERMGIAVGTSKSQLSLARQHLRRSLGPRKESA